MVKEIIFIELNKLSYLSYREQIFKLYFKAFTTGKYAQYIERSSVEVAIDELINIGCGIMAFSDERLVGFLIASPLSAHSEFHFNNLENVLVDKTIYINEIAVDADFRGRGIAEKMIKIYTDKILHKYHNAVIRVWEENIPALSLYKKLNFNPIASITQLKVRTNGEEFEMNKIYLIKKLIADN